MGEAKLAVFSPDPAKEGAAWRKTAELRRSSSKEPIPPMPAVDRTKWFAIPTDYSNVERSGLRVIINGGPNTHHIEMK